MLPVDGDVVFRGAELAAAPALAGSETRQRPLARQSGWSAWKIGCSRLAVRVLLSSTYHNLRRTVLMAVIISACRYRRPCAATFECIGKPRLQSWLNDGTHLGTSKIMARSDEVPDVGRRCQEGMDADHQHQGGNREWIRGKRREREEGQGCEQIRKPSHS
jgi:hypothetical protein